ncbi:MAG: CYTH domain-containing protein, partial [Alphaproteobacteria bacterium]|nr:CYTH domain-containing protein [Alphaproteobacteria bacterium]
KVFRHFAAKKSVRDNIEHKYKPRAYFDTENLDLDQKAISVRVQYVPGKGMDVGGYEQTVKFDLPHGSVMAGDALFRKECKDMVPDADANLKFVSDPEARAILKTFRAEKLSHLFTAAIERRYFEMEAGKGKKKGTVEIAFDVGEIILTSDGTRHALYEIEIESKRGSAKAINAVKKKILGIAPSAKVQTLSKSQQGSELYRRSKKRLARRAGP